VFKLAKIRACLLGIGNAASALVQGLYLCHKLGEELEGIINWDIGGYKPTDVEIVAAFDVDARKVGKDLSKAIFSEPNNMARITEVPKQNITVEKGLMLDDMGPFAREMIKLSEKEEADILDILKQNKVDVVVNIISGFAHKSSEEYAKISAQAGAGFINCTPTIIIGKPEIVRMFEENKAPIAGDDLESQVGSTALHRAILSWLNRKGVRVLSTYALDVGGSPEAFGSLDRDTLFLKRKIKTEAIISALPYKIPAMAGSMDYVDFLRDYRDTLIHIAGKFFAGAPVTIEVKIRVPDSLNAFNPIIDAIRAMKIAIDRGIYGTLDSLSAYHFKRPPVRMEPIDAEKAFWEFVNGARNR